MARNVSFTGRNILLVEDNILNQEKEAGMDGHPAKPLDETTLRRAIGKYMLPFMGALFAGCINAVCEGPLPPPFADSCTITAFDD